MEAQFCPNCGMRFSDLEYASFGRRLGGYLLDYVLAGVLGVVVGIIVALIIMLSLAPSETMTEQQHQEQEDAENVAVGALFGVYFVAAVTYYTVLNAYGGTPGKRVLGMRLEDAVTGDNIGLGRSFVRWVVSIASGMVVYLGYLWCIWDDENQTWHDKAAGSVVVRS